MGERNRRDFGLEGCLVGVILEERKWWGPTVFSLGPPFFSPPNWRENGEEKWLDVNYLSNPSPPQ